MAEPRHVLITGGSGRIGVEAVRYFRECGIAVTSLSNTEHESLEAERIVLGDAADEALVAGLLRDHPGLPPVDAVLHMAALAHPDRGTPLAVYGTNVVATFNVLMQAAEAEIQNVVIASSIAASGLTFSNHEVRPAYFPLDTRVPADIADWYSLSKAADELTARMVSRRFGTTIVALRLPYCNAADGLRSWSQRNTEDPTLEVNDGWGYLHARDVGRAALASFRAGLAGYNGFHIAARETCLPYLTSDLLDRYAPDVPRRRAFTGREVPIDLGDAQRLIGFEAEYALDLEPRPLPREPAAR